MAQDVPSRRTKTCWKNKMATQQTIAASLSIDTFTSSEEGAWSNSHLISGRSEAALLDVFQLRSEATQLAEKITQWARRLRPR
jgi:hypothetical protein